MSNKRLVMKRQPQSRSEIQQESLKITSSSCEWHQLVCRHPMWLWWWRDGGDNWDILISLRMKSRGWKVRKALSNPNATKRTNKKESKVWRLSHGQKISISSRSHQKRTRNSAKLENQFPFLPVLVVCVGDKLFPPFCIRHHKKTSFYHLRKNSFYQAHCWKA